jgi:hypothetical protein
MWGWLAKNKDWVFSGVGVFAISLLLLIRKLFEPRNEPMPAAAVSNGTQQPTISNTSSPNITVSPQVANPEVKKEEPAASSPTPVKGRANLKVEAIKLGHIYLHGDIWTLNPVPERWASLARDGMLTSGKERPHLALLIDIANVSTHSENIGLAKVKGVLKIQSRTYSPLPWLEEYTNAVRLGPADRKTVVLAVGSDHVGGLGPWHLVLNHRNNINSLAKPSKMDFTNLAPLRSDPLAEVLLVDIDTGELLFKFHFVWTFDLNSNRPLLKASSDGGDKGRRG